MENNEGKVLEELRHELDEIDRDLFRLLEERMDVCLDIAREKRRRGLAVFDAARECKVIEDAEANCRKYSEAARKTCETILDSSKKLQRSAMNIYLVGMPNCGKSKLAGKLGIELNRRSIDTDRLVMKSEKMTIDDIFDRYSEEFFRKAEHLVLERAAAAGSLVVATGGGVLTYEPNIQLLKNSGIIVFLNRSIDCLLHAKLKNRPLIRAGKESIIELYNERLPIYSALSDITVDPDSDDAVRGIISYFNSFIAGNNIG